METFEANGKQHSGYLALPASGKGPGLLLLHAWWGLTDLFKELADKLAAEGFVVFAPDLMNGAQTADITEAERQVQAAEADFAAVTAVAEAATGYLQQHPANTASKLASLGFSFGAAYALVLDEALPDAFGKVVLFYGMAGADVNKSKAQVLGHFAENDPFEDTEAARKMSAPNLELHIYPGTGHWFFEENRPDAYNAEAAKLAWERTLAFLKG
ncbi:MAG: dienelactone hydrolase family protein [Anaerolineales bacterium]|nr:dienelactone hydrolase family protein [Anaerolineales bacterium]